MQAMMTIAQFADRTGLAPSTLRFYERKGLLAPHRLANGDQVYAAEQVCEAQVIGSLRHAGVSLTDIQRFMTAGTVARTAILAHWRKEAAARLLSVQIAGRYLNGTELGQNEVHLMKWDEPATMLWFGEVVPLGPLPFAGAIERRTAELEQAEITILAGGYVRSQELLEGGRVAGEVGFQVKLKPGQEPPEGARREQVGPTLFAGLECGVADQHACDRVLQFIRCFGFQPVGGRLERYIPGHPGRYQLIFPVTRADTP